MKQKVVTLTRLDNSLVMRAHDDGEMAQVLHAELPKYLRTALNQRREIQVIFFPEYETYGDIRD